MTNAPVTTNKILTLMTKDLLAAMKEVNNIKPKGVKPNGKAVLKKEAAKARELIRRFNELLDGMGV